MLLLSRTMPPTGSLPALVTREWSADFSARLGALLGVEEGILKRMHYGTAARMEARFLGYALHRDHVTPTRRRLCPLCLRESEHHRMIWDLTILTVCPIHSVSLVDHCPNPRCGRPLTWRTAHVGKCSEKSCGMEIRRARPQPMPPDALEGARAICGYLDGSRALDVGYEGIGVEDLLPVVPHLGGFATGLKRVGRPTWLLEQHRDTLHEIVNAGWMALNDWPHSFHSLLDELYAQSQSRDGRFGLNKAFGYLSTWLSLNSAESWIQPLSAEFAAYLIRKDDLASTAAGLRRYGPIESLRGRNYTAREAANILGVSTETMTDLAEREDLYIVRPSGAGAPSTLRADKVDELVRRKPTMLSMGEAGELLDITQPTLRAMEAAGLLIAIPANKRIIVHNRFGRNDLVSLVERLGSRTSAENGEKDGRGLLPVTANKTLARSLPDICKAILEGKIVPQRFNTDATGLSRIVVSKDDVLRALPRERQTLSILQAAAELGVAADTIRLWIERGFLKAVVLNGVKREVGQRVTPNDLENFKATFATAITVASEFGFGTGSTVTRRLRYLGVRPVSGPSVDRGLGSLFRRSDLPTDPHAELIPSKKKQAEQRSSKQAYETAAAIGAASARLLHCSLKRWRNDFRNEDRKLFVQVLTGRRATGIGPYIFRFNQVKVIGLESAQTGWVAFGFPNRPFFLLVPWPKVRPFVDPEKADRVGILVHVDAQGRVDRWNDFCHELSPVERFSDWHDQVP